MTIGSRCPCLYPKRGLCEISGSTSSVDVTITNILPLLLAACVGCRKPAARTFARFRGDVFHMSAMAGKPEESLGSASLLAPKHHSADFPHVKFEKTIMVATTTIDAWAKRSGVAKLDFIWLDIQGTELQVLKAAPDIMKTVKVVITEVEFVETYAGQALFTEIQPWFETQGFELVGADFAPDAPAKADLKSRNALSWYGNAVFVR